MTGTSAKSAHTAGRSSSGTHRNRRSVPSARASTGIGPVRRRLSAAPHGRSSPSKQWSPNEHRQHPRRHTERNCEVESTLLEQLLIPWWKPVVYVATLVIAAVTIRISIKFDFNEWQKNRQRERRTKEQQKAVERCSHVWTLYPHSQYSICNICQVLHSTSTLMALRGSPGIVIAGERYGMDIKAEAGALIAMDPYGRRKRK